LKVWIDATKDAQRKVFGMSPLERMLRSLVDGGRPLSPSEVRIELGPNTPIPSLPEELTRKLPLVWSSGDASTCQRLEQAAEDACREPLLALSADTIVDIRLLEHLVSTSTPRAFFGATGETPPTAFRLDDRLPEDLVETHVEADLATIARACVDRGFVKEFSPDDFSGYIPKLRRTNPAYLLPIAGRAEAEAAERFLFHSNYKGATDFLTKYVFPPLVWRIVRPLAARRVKPNTVTAVSIVCCFAAVPFFAGAWWVSGLLLAYAMCVLDSVDGKLARVTFSSSKYGHLLDHGTDYIHPPIWYSAWALGLSGGDFQSSIFQASLWLAGLYIVDRVLENLFKTRVGGRSIQDYTPLDTLLRTFVSRRNVNLALFTIALPFGLGVPAFYAVLGLQAATVAYHLARLVQFWNAGDARRLRAFTPIAAEDRNDPGAPGSETDELRSRDPRLAPLSGATQNPSTLHIETPRAP
jgi:phosphatidylglycerophosphate synthase